MATLIACISTGKGTWSEVSKVINAQPWTNIILITNTFGQENFTSRPPHSQVVLIDSFQEVSSLIQHLKKELHARVKDFEVALNFSSGTGKEHMALLETVLELGFNFRLVTVDYNQVEVLGLKA